MAAGCSKKFTSKYEEELYYDVEYEEFCKTFEFSNSSTCWICNGYYGPNYEEPLCGTCHSFIFPNHPQDEAEGLVTEVSDDEDSGNDEPPENGSEAKDRSDGDPDDYDHLDRPRPSAPRNVNQYLEMLSQPRETDESERQICALPVEVLLSIFSYLDDLSLWNASEVCKQWKRILEVHIPQQMWKKYTKERWPLFQQISTIPNWLHMYGALMNSCFCRTCLIQMAHKAPMRGRVNHIRANRLRNDIRSLDLDATEGIDAVALDNQLFHWQASILGPAGSPYEGGKFFLYIVIPCSYPMLPPQVRFLTKIVHPNVSRHGDVGIDIIQHNWSLALTISKLLLSVQSLLTDPFTQICMEPELGRMYENDRPKFEALARRWTWKYAMYEVLPPVEGLI
ncbi:uncharacterized protein LOC126564823 [Anopheles maculipalpis]|uniref:uncharacterized protein LOC126564823 n=1 Tax=Anopheles maculipalpis TaxID=1496333 RepID=UPI002159AB31|nr:uncharacterized protein LOC126564823 [Anopheles maculipalpis]